MYSGQKLKHIGQYLTPLKPCITISSINVNKIPAKCGFYPNNFQEKTEVIPSVYCRGLNSTYSTKFYLSH